MQKYICGSIFFRNNSLLSKIIRWGTIFQKRKSGEIKKSKWSHCGIIFLRANELYLLEAKWPKVKATKLLKILMKTKKENYEIKILDKESRQKLCNHSWLFKAECESLINKKYSIFSAIASGLDFPFDLKKGGKGVHCSYMADYLYKKIGILDLGYNSRESTPDDVYYHNFLEKSDYLI